MPFVISFQNLSCRVKLEFVSQRRLSREYPSLQKPFLFKGPFDFSGSRNG